MVGVLRGFDPDVVHLASPALLGYGGLHAARLPRRADGGRIPNRHRGFRRELRRRGDVAGGVGVERVICTPVPTGPSRRRRRRWKTWSHTAFRGCTTGVAASTYGLRYPRRATTALGPKWSPDGKPIIGFVGRLAPEKHVERLAGVGRPRRSPAWWWSVTASTGTSSNPSCPQPFSPVGCMAPNWPPRYASMDVFVHPGEHETFCQAVQEAMASGLPVVAPDAGGPRDLVTPMQHRIALAGQRVRGPAASSPSIT